MGAPFEPGSPEDMAPWMISERLAHIGAVAGHYVGCQISSKARYPAEEITGRRYWTPSMQTAWGVVNSCCLLPLLCDKQEEVAKMLSLQSPSPRTESADEFGQSQLLYSVELQNNDAVEDLLMARADVTRMRDIAEALQHTRLT